MRYVVTWSLTILALSSGFARAAAQEHVPLGLDLYVAIPDDNPLTTARIALGRALFFDIRLSADRKVSCSSCHQPAQYLTDGRQVSLGVYGRVGIRNVPSILNSAWRESFFWDGRQTKLEEQVLQPIVNPVEMGLTLEAAVTRVAAVERYKQSFAAIFADGVTPENLGRVLASFVRTLRAGDAAFDRFSAGDSMAISVAARRGYGLFVGKALCMRCHSGALFTDEEFHNTGVSPGRDAGREFVTGLQADRGKFRTPSLRNVEFTAPYMHDGSLATLPEVVRFYDGGGNANPNLDRLIRPLGLSDDEQQDLVAFLKTLTSGVGSR